MTIDQEISLRPKRPSAVNLVYASETLDSKLLRSELGLHLSRFPGHTGDVVSLNFQFAKAYQSAFRDQFALISNGKGAQNVKGLDIKLFSPLAHDLKDRAGVRKAIHRARQMADVFGLSYDVFIRFCFNFAVGQGKSKYIKQPNQLIPIRLTSVLWKKQLRTLIETEGRAKIIDYHANNSVRKCTPACFGVMWARIESSAICLACPDTQNCGVAGGRIFAHIEKVVIESGKQVLLSAKLRASDTAKRQRNRLKRKMVVSF